MLLKTQHSSKGFTIVELLIVIVVIAILAAISIVAYNGIQTRAENNKTISAVAQYVKALKAYASSNGKYPDPSGYGLQYSCLGPTGSPCGTISGSTACYGIGAALGLAGFTQHMTTNPDGVMNAMPELSKQTISCSGGSERAMGGLYASYDQGTTAGVYYFLKGNTECGSPSGSTATPSPNNGSIATFCTIILRSS